MPTGTGKTVSLLSVFVSYLIAHPENYTKVFIYYLIYLIILISYCW